MTAGFDLQLWFALALVVLAVAVFCWHFISTTRRFGLAMSESRVPRRYLLLGVLIGLGALYLKERYMVEDNG